MSSHLHVCLVRETSSTPNQSLFKDTLDFISLFGFAFACHEIELSYPHRCAGDCVFHAPFLLVLKYVYVHRSAESPTSVDYSYTLKGVRR